jgi:hypothetical protein
VIPPPSWDFKREGFAQREFVLGGLLDADSLELVIKG